MKNLVLTKIKSSMAIDDPGTAPEIQNCPIGSRTVRMVFPNKDMYTGNAGAYI